MHAHYDIEVTQPIARTCIYMQHPHYLNPREAPLLMNVLELLLAMRVILLRLLRSLFLQIFHMLVIIFHMLPVGLDTLLSV